MLDVLSTQSPGFAQAARTQPGRLRVGVVRGFPLGAPGRLSDEVSGALDRAAELLGSLGHTVAEQKIDLRPQDTAVILGLMFRFIRELVHDVERPQRLERRTRAFARAGALISDRTKERLLRGQDRLAERLGRLFDDHDVLLTPMMSEPAVPAGIMEGRGATATYFWESGWVPFTILWNVTGQPAASVPAGFSSHGLPLAVQIVGRPNHESTLLSLAAQIEAESPWSDRRPASPRSDPASTRMGALDSNPACARVRRARCCRNVADRAVLARLLLRELVSRNRNSPGRHLCRGTQLRIRGSSHPLVMIRSPRQTQTRPLRERALCRARCLLSGEPSAPGEILSPIGEFERNVPSAEGATREGLRSSE